MAISFKNYVNIVSGIGAGAAVKLRELMLRLFTTNPLLPTGETREFTSADQVGAYFGTNTPEHLRAIFYFGWVSKMITRASKISFARWAPVAVAPRIFGAKNPQVLSNWQGVTDGAFVLTLGSTSNAITALNFSAATSLANVASIIQTAINAKTGIMWTAATVTYDAVRGSFNFTGGTTGDATISAAANLTGTNILGDLYLGWNSNGIFSDGSNAELPVETLAGSAESSNNFGSFAFMDELTPTEHQSVAQWNLTQNNTFMYLVPLLDYSDRLTLQAALDGIGGVAITYSPIATEYPEIIPGMILAATDYTRANAVQNYMYQQFAVTPSVTTDEVSEALDPLRINYYGATQTAGQSVEFYQRGLLQGLAVDPSDMNVYANEVWLKDFMGAEIMGLFLAVGRVPANTEGRGLIFSSVQTGVDAALLNGTISPGKALTNTQRAYVSQVTGDKDSWRQVERVGYSTNVKIQPVVIDDRTEYEGVYVLVYSKDDAVRKVSGSHILI